IKSMYNLTSVGDIKLLNAFCCRAVFDTGEVLVPPSIKKEIAEELNMDLSQISRSIKSLIAKGLITYDGGRVQLNPFLLWKGSTRTREKLLKEGGLELRIKFQYKEKE